MGAPWARHKTGGLVIAGLLAVLPGCGGGSGAEGDPVVAAAPIDNRSVAPATTSPPASTTSTRMRARPGRHPGDELRVLLAGDSMMKGLGPAVAAALDPTGPTPGRTRLEIPARIPRDPAARRAWEQALDEFDPDVVVVLVSVWEWQQASDEHRSLSVAGDRAAYAAEVLAPFVGRATAGGARIVWVAAPVMNTALVTGRLGQLNLAVREYATSSAPTASAVTVLSPDHYIGGAATMYVDVVTGPDGVARRTRGLDGSHLCPDGAVALTGAVLTEIQRTDAVSTRPQWSTGAWRTGPEYPPTICPP